MRTAASSYIRRPVKAQGTNEASDGWMRSSRYTTLWLSRWPRQTHGNAYRGHTGGARASLPGKSLLLPRPDGDILVTRWCRAPRSCRFCPSALVAASTVSLAACSCGSARSRIRRKTPPRTPSSPRCRALAAIGARAVRWRSNVHLHRTG
jgi:hypothetical protein